MKAKLFTKDMVFIDVIDISQLSFKRQRNKEYTISCKPIADTDYNWEQVSFIYFLDDNEEKTKRIQYKPCGYLEGYNGDSLSIKSMESYLESISIVPENFEWWQNKLLKNVLPDLCYGFRRIKKASLSEMQDVATSYHVKFDVLENGNGEVYADTGYYFSPSNTHELYYYSDGYVIYRMILPEDARRQGLVLRWSDQTGTTTDISVQFRWSNVPSDFIGAYSAEQSPLRGEGSRKNETVGVDIPESDNTYLFVKFNLKYDTGSTSIFPKGYNYEQEITTVEGEGEENYVYYGKTAILNAFEVIYRVDTRIEEGTIDVSDTQLMQADLSNCNSLLSVLKAISEAYNLTFFVSFEENIPLLNVYNEYINDTTNQTIITDKINSTVTRKDIKTETLHAVEAFGIGNGFDRIHAFVKYDDSETNIKNIGKYEGEETSVEELITNAKEYIEKENEELSSASFEYYNMPLQVNDKVRAVINRNVYTSLITEENYSFDGDKTEKEYTIGIRKYAFSGFFTSPFSGLFLYKPETPTNLIATRMEQGWAVSWQGKTSRYILQYRRSSVSPWNTLSVTGTHCTIPFTEYDLDYTFAIYAVDDRGQYSDAMYVYSNSSIETIYIWETYHDGDSQPDTPTGSGNTGGWNRDLTQNAKWVSKKEAHRITEGSWSVPVLTSNGVRLGVLDDTPDDVTGLSAYATKDGIQIQCNPMGVGAKNVVQSFEFELLLEGASEWIWLRSFTNSAFYAFDRDIDGYPEASDIDGSQVRCKVKNTYNYISVNYATATVNTDNYGTWNVLPPDVISAQSATRAANVTWQRKDKTPLGKDIYGISFYDIQISMNASTWFKPAQGKTGKVSESDWQDGSGQVRLSGGSWSQSLPLTGQTLGLPVNTTYYYRVRTRGITDEYLSDWSSPVTAIALATGIGDIIAGTVTEQILAPDAVTYEKLNVLAVNKINSFVKGKNDYWTTIPDAGTKNCTIEVDAETGLQCGVLSSNLNGITNSNKFEVLPDDILEVNITVFKDIAIGTTYVGLQSYAEVPNWNCQYANYNTIAKSWGTFNNASNFYFSTTLGSTNRLTLKTYIVGYNVTPDKIPAPNIATACARMLPGQTKANLRILNFGNAGTTTKLYILAPRVINIASGQLLAKQIVTPSLSAINANVGEITSGILRSVVKAGESKPNVFLDLNTEEFRVGNNPSLEDSNREDAEYLHWKPNRGLFLKLKNLIVDAIASTIRGRFRVRGTTATMAQSVLIVNTESTVDPDTNTPANTTVIKTALQCPAGITGNLSGNASTATAPLYQWKKTDLYRYVAGESPTTTYYWYKVCKITTAMTFDVEVVSNQNFPYRASYRLSVSTYTSTSKTYTVALLNLGQTDTAQAKLAVALDADGYVYIQTNAIWTSSLFVNLIYSATNNFSITMDKLGYAPFGTESGFTPVNLIEQTGAFRWTTSGILQSTTPIINTDIRGNVTGNVTGNLTGNVTGSTGRFNSAEDASETAVNNVALITGPVTGQHLEIDGNEILSKNGSSTETPLYLGKYIGMSNAPYTPDNNYPVSIGNNVHMNGKSIDHAERFHCRDYGDGDLRLTTKKGELTGYPNSYLPTIKTSRPWLNFDIASTYAFAIGSSSGTTSLLAGTNTKLSSSAPFYGAVGNDICDNIKIASPVKDFEYGYCYCEENGEYRKGNKGIIGITSDTASIHCGSDDGMETGKDYLPIAIGGFVLAYVDNKYRRGTPLKAKKDGSLTRAYWFTPCWKVVATYQEEAREDPWNKAKVNGRVVVRVK